MVDKPLSELSDVAVALALRQLAERGENWAVAGVAARGHRALRTIRDGARVRFMLHDRRPERSLPALEAADVSDI